MTIQSGHRDDALATSNNIFEGHSLRVRGRRRAVA